MINNILSHLGCQYILGMFIYDQNFHIYWWSMIHSTTWFANIFFGCSNFSYILMINDILNHNSLPKYSPHVHNFEYINHLLRLHFLETNFDSISFRQLIFWELGNEIKNIPFSTDFSGSCILWQNSPYILAAGRWNYPPSSATPPVLAARSTSPWAGSSPGPHLSHFTFITFITFLLLLLLEAPPEITRIIIDYRNYPY